MITIDLATKIVLSEQKIWLVHAGKGRRFYDYFRNYGCVFLDLPGLNLDKHVCSSTENIRQHVRMANALKRFHNGVDNAPPSRNPLSYPSSPDKGINSDVGNVQGLFCSAKKGDLVIVTGYGHYEKVLIGEFSDSFNPLDKIRIKDEYEDFNCRKINWISTDYSRREFPLELSKKLTNPKTVVQLDRSTAVEQIYKFAYRSYVLQSLRKGDISKIDFDGPAYNGKDYNAISNAQNVIQYFANAFYYLQQNRAEEFSKLTFEEAISLDNPLVESFTVNFNSPGKYSLVTKSAALMAFLALEIALFTSPCTAEDIISNTINPVNSVSQSVDEEFIEACKQHDKLIKSFGDTEICEKIKKKAEEADKKIKLKTTAKVVHE